MSEEDPESAPRTHLDSEMSLDSEELAKKLPLDQIAQFIVQVRKAVSRDYPNQVAYERAFRRLKNLSTPLYRDHIGYTPEGAYRLKAKEERTFQDGLEEVGGRENVLARFTGKNPLLSKILRGDPPVELPVDERLAQVLRNDSEASQVSSSAPPSPPEPKRQPTGEDEIPWAEDFDPESEEKLAVQGAATVPLLCLEDLQDQKVVLETEAIDPEDL